MAKYYALIELSFEASNDDTAFEKALQVAGLAEGIEFGTTAEVLDVVPFSSIEEAEGVEVNERYG